MKRLTLPLTAVLLLACTSAPGPAQETIPPPEEKLPPVLEAPPVHAPCDHSHPGVKLLWLDRDEPIQVLTPREVPVQQVRPALQVFFRPEKRTVIETVIESREVTREVPFTTMKPVMETCPTTGECHPVMQPCTEMRTVKERVFYPVTKEKTYEIQVPYLKEVQETVTGSAILLEYRTEWQKVPAALAVPSQELHPRFFVAPNACPHHP